MPTHRGCKCCSSPNRDYIDRAIGDRVPARLIIEELGRRGELGFSQTNISNHRRKHWEPPADPSLDAAIEDLQERLTAEMRAAPSATVAAGYLVLLHQLAGLKGSKASPEGLIKAISAVNRIGGLRSDQENLLAYMAAKWPGQGEESPPHLRIVAPA
jgi:hypothetical protein